MQFLGPKKQVCEIHATSWAKKNNATSWAKKSHPTSQAKKSHAIFKANKKVTQPLGTKQKIRQSLDPEKDHATMITPLFDEVFGGVFFLKILCFTTIKCHKPNFRFFKR